MRVTEPDLLRAHQAVSSIRQGNTRQFESVVDDAFRTHRGVERLLLALSTELANAGSAA